MTERTLAISSNHGRYALDDADGPDISSGQPLDILVGGKWISGSVEHGDDMYANRGLRFLGDPGPDTVAIEGYYFIADTGEKCGLCVGMVVRVPSRY